MGIGHSFYPVMLSKKNRSISKIFNQLDKKSWKVFLFVKLLVLLRPETGCS